MTNPTSLDDALKPEEPDNSNPIDEIKALDEKKNVAGCGGCASLVAGCIMNIGSAYSAGYAWRLLKDGPDGIDMLKITACLIPTYLTYKLYKTAIKQLVKFFEHGNQLDKKLEELHEDYEKN